MIKLYTHENRMILFNVRNLLQAAGIETVVRNEYVGGGVGDLPAFDAWPELWLEDESRLEQARSIVEQVSGNGRDGEWLCRACQEPNHESFQICWRCGQPAD